LSRGKEINFPWLQLDKAIIISVLKNGEITEL